MKKLDILCSECQNNNCFIKKYCLETETLIKDIAENKTTNRYFKDQHIFMEGSFVDGINFVQSGRVKVYKTGILDKNQIIRLVVEGGVLGHRGLSNRETYSISAQALSETIICSFDKTYFIDLLKKSPALTYNLMLFFANELNLVESTLRDLSVFNVREKVAKAILILIDSFGLSKSNNINYISYLSRQNISELVGLNSNQVSKIFSEFKEEKILEIKGKNIKVLNIKKLEEIILP